MGEDVSIHAHDEEFTEEFLPVVGVQPLDHLLKNLLEVILAFERAETYQGRHINTLLLETTAHGEVLIKAVEVVLAVALGDNTEELDVVKDLIVESKVVAGDGVDASILLDLPVLQTETLALRDEIIAGGLATPVSFRGLLQVTEPTHTGETENGAKWWSVEQVKGDREETYD